MNYIEWYIAICVSFFFIDLLASLYRLGKANGEVEGLELKDQYSVEVSVWSMWLDVLMYVPLILFGLKLIFSNILRAVGVQF